MADIRRIKLPNGTTYNIKDNPARTNINNIVNGNTKLPYGKSLSITNDTELNLLDPNNNILSTVNLPDTGTELWTAPGGIWEMKVTVGSTTVTGSTVKVTESAAEMTSPSGTTYPGLTPAQPLGISQGDIIHITFTGTLPSDTVDTITIGRYDFYTLNLSQAGAMANEYYGTVTTVGYPGSTLNQIATPAPVTYDRLKVVAPLKVTNDGTDDCLGADFKLPDKVVLRRGSTEGYTQISMLDENDFSVGITTYFNSLTPVIYGSWTNYDSTDECFKGISLNVDSEHELAEDCILVVKSAYEGCQYAKITFDIALFGGSIVRFCNEADGATNTWYFTTTRDTYFRVTYDNGDIMLTPIENPSYKYTFIKNATDIDVSGPTKDSTATVNQIIGAMLAVYGWGDIDTATGRIYVLKTSTDANINPQTKISLIKGRDYVECQHFTAPVTGIYKLINSGGGRPIIPIKAVSCSPYASDPNLCANTSAVFYDNQATAANRGWKLPQEANWPSDADLTDYCYNFFIFGELQSGVI